MKKAIPILIIIFVFCSCGAFKKTITKKQNKQTTTTIEKAKDSTSVVENNKAIKDNAVINVPESNTGDVNFDKRVNEAVANVLKNINFNKQSGDNGYKLYYDAQLKQIKAQIAIAATQNKNTKTSENNNQETTVFEQFETYVKKVKLPWWMYLIVVFLLRKWIVKAIVFFVPAASGIKTAKDLFTPPSKD